MPHTGPPVPIILIAARAPDDPGVVVAAETTVRETIKRRGDVAGVAEIAVLDMHSATRRDVIVAGLLLRNAGRTVIVCEMSRLPQHLVRQLHDFSVAEKSAGSRVRTELILTEEAMEFFGDIGDVVAYFEREFIVN